MPRPSDLRGWARLVNGWKYSRFKLPGRVWRKFGRYARRAYGAKIDGKTIWFPEDEWNDGDGYGATDAGDGIADWCLDVLDAWLKAENIVLDGKKYYFRD